MVLELRYIKRNIHFVLFVFIYLFINFLFIYKYVARIINYPFFVAIGIILILTLIIYLMSKDYSWFLILDGRKYYTIFVSFTAIVLWFLMSEFDPAEIQVGRYPALHDWIQRILNGELPYNSDVPHTGFPFWFLIVLPFYLLGDLGLLQIFCFVLFAFLLETRQHAYRTYKMQIIVLLLLSPIFLYEIVVRSDLFSNMVLVLLYLNLHERFLGKFKFSNIVFGFAGGLLLSTRAIVIIPFILFFGYHFKTKPIKNSLYFSISAAVGFILTMIPFLIWDFGSFVSDGPFSRQSAYIQLWQLILVIGSAGVLAITSTTQASVYRNTAYILFATSFLVFLTRIIGDGWNSVIFQHGFDISYFSFPLPFLFFALPNVKNRNV